MFGARVASAVQVVGPEWVGKRAVARSMCGGSGAQGLLRLRLASIRTTTLNQLHSPINRSSEVDRHRQHISNIECLNFETPMHIEYDNRQRRQLQGGM